MELCVEFPQLLGSSGCSSLASRRIPPVAFVYRALESSEVGVLDRLSGPSTWPVHSDPRWCPHIVPGLSRTHSRFGLESSAELLTDVLRVQCSFLQNFDAIWSYFKSFLSVRLISSSSFNPEMIQKKFVWKFILLSSTTSAKYFIKQIMSGKKWFSCDWIILRNVSVQKQNSIKNIWWFCRG
jgi:hypothetical protein